jgi:hypothetical protein
MHEARPLAARTLAVVGAPFPNADGSDRGAEIALCSPGEPVVLQPEPANEHDPRAVAVFSARGVQIGYLSAERCGWIGSIIRSGREVRATFQAESDFGAWVRVSFDGSDPVLPLQRTALPSEPDSGWFPDEIWPDD